MLLGSDRMVFSKNAWTGAITAHGPPCLCTKADGSNSLNSKPATTTTRTKITFQFTFIFQATFLSCNNFHELRLHNWKQTKKKIPWSQMSFQSLIKIDICLCKQCKRYGNCVPLWCLQMQNMVSDSKNECFAIFFYQIFGKNKNERKPWDHRWNTSSRMFEPQTISRNPLISCSALTCGAAACVADIDVDVLAISSILNNLKRFTAFSI